MSAGATASADLLRALRLVMLVQAASLLVAAALHAGLVMAGPFDQAAVYEASLGVLLLLALGLSFVVSSQSAGLAALAAQALTLAGASLGVYLALLGVAPDSTLDIVYHVALIGLLIVGLVLAWRVRAS
jgi:hypothetical protein